MHQEFIHFVLAGNPNSGKTSLFNNLTGANQRVANYPGVTVETKSGQCTRSGVHYRITDLPGTYSLTANSPEEQIARDYILRRKPDVVVQVVDASNLERSLYLTLQLLEQGARVVLDLNMIDEAHSQGLRIDRDKLGLWLGLEVVDTVATRNQGSDDLLRAVQRALERDGGRWTCQYGDGIGPLIDRLSERLNAANGSAMKFPARWAAVKYLEGDNEVRSWLKAEVCGGAEIEAEARRAADALSKQTGDSPEALIAEARYGLLSGICRETVTHEATPWQRQRTSEFLDSILLHRQFGFPLFLLLMYGLFQFVFTVGESPCNWIESGFAWLKDAAGDHIAEGPLRSLFIDGIISGVGGVLVFVPNILLLFFAIGLLENSGYMARAAFIIDRVMSKIGLHGRSFIPLMTGFGCSIPAIMSTRILEHEKDRLATMMVIPLMSCSARLPIYSVLIPAFFPVKWRGFMFFLIYSVGVLLAVAFVKLLRVSILSGEATPFVMELPPYRVPTLRAIWLDMSNKAWMYVHKAGTVILALSIILWAATSYPKKQAFAVDAIPRARMITEKQIEGERGAESLAYSIAGRIGQGMETVFRPLGFDWKICTALIGALAAKEVFVAQMGIVYSLVQTGDENTGNLTNALKARYTPLVGFCIMLFCLITSPCMSTVVIMRRESNSWKWPLIQFCGLTAMAYLLTLIVYQAGAWLKIGV